MATRIYHPELSDLPAQSLTPDAVHHLVNVLRKQIGDKISLFDGCGRFADATLVEITKKYVNVSLSDIQLSEPTPLSINLVQSLCKGDKMDYVIQKAVELGVSEITPVVSCRSQVRLDPKRCQKKWQHWFQVMVCACEQCGQNFLPKLNEIVSFDVYLAQWSKVGLERPGVGLMLSPTVSGIDKALLKGDRFDILVGPEGGFAPEEFEKARRMGFNPWQLGPRVLRTETAGLVAASVLQYQLGDFKSEGLT